MTQEPNYVIIGGGIAGASIAYHLGKRSGGSVTLLERKSLASETTAKSMALLGKQGSETIVRMKDYSFQLYNEFLSDARSDPAFHLIGSMGVATTEDGKSAFTESVETTTGEDGHDSLLTGAASVPSELLLKDEIKKGMITPLLNTSNVVAALYKPKRWYGLPQELAFEFVDRAVEGGVTVKTDCEVTDIELRDGRVSGVHTTNGKIEANHVISAAGPWNPMIADMVGVSLPLKHTLAPILQLRPTEPLRYMVPHTKHFETRVYFRGRHDGTVFVGQNPNEITPFDEAEQFNPEKVSNTVSAEVRAELTEIMELLYPDLMDAEEVDEWVGIRSMTPDGYPIVGWTSVPGFSVAGFNSSGINLAPAVGDIIARQLVENDPTEFYEDISITRFDGFSDIKQE